MFQASVRNFIRISAGFLKRLNARGVKDFQWQGGYADFSVSASNLDAVRAYIEKQGSIIVR
jgi:hypothetical protein